MTVYMNNYVEAMRNNLFTQETKKAIKIRSKQENFKKQMGLVLFRIKLKSFFVASRPQGHGVL